MSNTPKRSDEAPNSPGLRFAIKNAARRLLDWFVIQSKAVRLTVLAVALLIPATGIYSFMLIRKQAAVAEQVKTMSVAGKAGEALWTFNDKLPVVFGAGSVAELSGNKPGRAHYSGLRAAAVERIGAYHPGRIAGQAVRVLP